ncbi:MAG TPA: SDR family NAD(P)-dependent oxidoreductase [Geminicoccus sp.]|jgi:short-subunit dehydrogenase|uniref:SDR family NAD(P)-dependent oxidoreductase n=1 Tax=Geminicoccus sp. TaxID=2024832 RepID=UPI002E381616|nr:SDR family NAD(P)-dependent oxidoreductase [Geminicoccus sp.]HEX2528054.1 SDR family NAD(P)-dependent oxidoreductase [Geminicoccus sp.]
MSARTVWITGASSGIGRALACELAARGNHVIASARRRDELDRLAAEQPGVVGWPLDITDHGAVVAAVTAIEAAHGPIDIAVLAAGTHAPVSARNFRAAELQQLCDLNLFGTANCLEALLGPMLARRRGKIAVLGSLAAYRGLPTAAYYAASKAALTAMVEALKFDCDRSGVALQLVQPGFVDTPLTRRNRFPMPFLLSAEEAARRLADGLDQPAFEIVFPRRFGWILKLLRLLPYRLYFPIVARTTRV